MTAICCNRAGRAVTRRDYFAFAAETPRYFFLADGSIGFTEPQSAASHLPLDS